MKILTRRNAMLGWATWKTAKGVAKYHKAKGNLPQSTTAKQKSKKKKRKIVAGALAAVGSIALLKRMRRRGSSEHAPDSSGE